MTSCAAGRSTGAVHRITAPDDCGEALGRHDTDPPVVEDVSFCHLVVGVTDMNRALTFYRGVLGMEVVFDRLISGKPFDAILRASRKQEGRVVGGLLGGLMVELLSLGAKPAAHDPGPRPFAGIHSVSLSVTDLDDTYRRVLAAGLVPDQEPFDIGGVRMFFVKDPDGTPVEFIELPGGVRSTYQMHRGGRQPRPAR